MKTLNVGGLNPFNRHKTFAEALEKAKPDDQIKFHKKEIISSIVDKHLIIDGGGKTLVVEPGMAGLIFKVPAIIKNVKFVIKSRSNALILNRGGLLENVTISFDQPMHELFPAIVHKEGKLTIKDSNIQKLVTHEGTYTEIHSSTLTDYYNGKYEFLDNENVSDIRGEVHIHHSTLNSTVFRGYSEVNTSTIGQYNMLAQSGKMKLNNSILKHLDIEQTFREKREPEHGPLSNSRNTSNYLLHNQGELTVNNYRSKDTGDFVGFFSTGGTVDIVNTNNTDESYHLMRNSSLGFSDTTDQAYYEIENSVTSQVRSQVRTSQKTKTAMEKLNELVGLGSVKQSVQSITNTIQMNQQNPNDDFAFSHHMIFAGDPGTGKTTVGKIVAQALFEVGAIPENKLTEVTVDKLIKGYVGQTASNVREILDDALGGVLFIDEAYELAVKDGQNSFNSEALSVIIRYMEDHRDELVVIAAGYPKEMQKFLASNIGLQRRFQWVEFEDYTTEELTDIFELMRTSHGKEYQSQKLASLIPQLFQKLTSVYLSKPDAFGRVTNGGNGGLVRNVYQQVIQTQNNRIMSGENSVPEITQDDLLNGFKIEIEKAIRT